MLQKGMPLARALQICCRNATLVVGLDAAHTS